MSGCRFSAEQMFDVVNSVSDYPQFVPWCKKAEVRKLSDNVVVAELKIGFPPLHEEYKSKVTSLRPLVVRVISDLHSYPFISELFSPFVLMEDCSMSWIPPGDSIRQRNTRDAVRYTTPSTSSSGPPCMPSLPTCFSIK